MSSGGDFWFATMSANDPHEASTAGRVIDHENGTYSVYFYAAWSGTAEINVTLVHPSKAVEFMNDTLWDIGPKVFWSATYKNFTILSHLKNKANKFYTSCWITRSNDTNIKTLCEFPSPNGLGNYTFVCRPPKDRRCRPLDIIAIDRPNTDAATAKSASGYEDYFQSVKPNSTSTQMIPSCFVRFVRHDRRMVTFETSKDYYKELNLSVRLRFHPQTITGTRIPNKLFIYFADILDSIQTHECAYLIIELSPWAHFQQWTRDSLTQRYIKLREAVSRLRLRCPNVPIIVKGPHFREHRAAFTRWGWSDYMYYQFGVLMEQIFQGSGIWFLNVWDMNLSFRPEHLCTCLI
ncbi:NXPE family member 3-like [Amphiura filiformis]|uniref:NXPE family member 3-like n=1 Tax=Amphiura filiformis TaxID=82378 RepID=UPI003B216C76